MSISATSGSRASLAVLYEHPQWFQPLFSTLGHRGMPFEAIHPSGHSFDPSQLGPPARQRQRAVEHA